MKINKTTKKEALIMSCGWLAVQCLRKSRRRLIKNLSFKDDYAKYQRWSLAAIKVKLLFNLYHWLKINYLIALYLIVKICIALKKWKHIEKDADVSSFCGLLVTRKTRKKLKMSTVKTETVWKDKDEQIMMG